MYLLIIFEIYIFLRKTVSTMIYFAKYCGLKINYSFLYCNQNFKLKLDTSFYSDDFLIYKKVSCKF